ncbi:MAG: phosphoglucosamine mutase [Candidatus Caldatribacterium sp.]|uniref:phosphoglucosamine mutase n=1 Tax=Candidatus Caldatribacterium sp. TaxID=2282143 RepID=UPI00299BD77B|nr:phosphoglucosamine mutase [Candidatus Caldatribacterium sp.]MCX7731494.1 phosphoglucosamine mutase [Candidatus Caldatribacterium sp.]MDW8081538.1 phosphoglucosamine mutase [Candidatus Calescibacterium sp.]
MPRLFGTFGIRRIANEVLTPEMATKLALSFGTFIGGEGVVVGRDARKTSKMLYDAVVAGLLSAGCQVIELEVTTTPALQWACRQWNMWGAMVTASHNPPEWNGIKFMEKSGKGLDREKEVEVERIFFTETFRRASWFAIPQETRKRDIRFDYIAAIMSRVDVEAIRRRNFRVVLDCANGAPSLITPYLLSEMGCHVVTLNAHPDGNFPGRNPEPTPENLQDIITLIRYGNFDLGFAQDGDGDRLIVITKEGEFVPGDLSVSLVARELAERSIPGPIVTTVATTHILQEIARATNREVITTAVGDLVVAKALQEHGGIFGCEENGGMIFPDFVWGRDGAMAAAFILHILATRGKPLSELLRELPPYYQVKRKVTIDPEKRDAVLQAVDAKTAREKNRITIDGFKVIFDDGSWVLVRPSGTEPLIRVFAEAKDKEKAEALVIEYLKLIEEAQK